MMTRLRLFSTAFLACLLWNLAAQAEETPSFTAKVSSTTVSLGESVTLSLNFSGFEAPEPPTLTIPGVEVTSQGVRMSSSQWGNVSESVVSYQYDLRPTRLGDFTIPAFTAVYKGRKCTTEPITVQVVKSAPQDHVLVILEADKTEVYVNEQVALTVKFIVDDHQRIRFRQGDGCTIPWFLNAEGFAVEPVQDFVKGLKGDLELPVNGVQMVPFQASRTKRGGREYVVCSLSKPMFTTSQGEHKIAACSLSCVYPRVEELLGAFQTPGQVILATSNELTIKVKPLPTEGRPADFSEAVGEFQMEASADPPSVHVGDPVTLKLRVFGPGNLQGVKSPSLGDLTGFKSYPGESPTTVSREGGKMVGSRSFTILLEPQSEDVKEIPAVKFVFFNPKLARYETLTQGPFALRVLPVERESAGRPRGPASPAPAKGWVMESAKEIMPIAEDLAGLENEGRPLYMNRLLWVVLPMPWFAAGISLLIRRRQERMRLDAGYARASRAMRAARQKLAEAKSLMGSAPGKQAYAGIARAVADFIADKLNLPPASVSADSARELLGRHGAAQEIVEAVVSFFASCDHARFSAVGAQAAAASNLLAKAEVLLRRLDDVL